MSEESEMHPSNSIGGVSYVQHDKNGPALDALDLKHARGTDYFGRASIAHNAHAQNRPRPTKQRRHCVVGVARGIDRGEYQRGNDGDVVDRIRRKGHGARYPSRKPLGETPRAALGDPRRDAPNSGHRKWPHQKHRWLGLKKRNIDPP